MGTSKQEAQQHPSNCADVPIFVLHTKEHGGIRHTMSMLSQQLAYGWKRLNATVVIDRQVKETGWTWVDKNPDCNVLHPDGKMHKLGFDCLWMPLSPCITFVKAASSRLRVVRPTTRRSSLPMDIGICPTQGEKVRKLCHT